jgi:anaerobic magnesium-protoporphyrin IX monomethyl ester cyclase
MKKIMLIHPPLDDPTIPYHSTAYLTGHLQHNGFTDVSMRDINVEFVNYCLEDSIANSFYEEATRRLAFLASRPSLNFREQEQYYAFLSARRPDLQAAVRALRDMDSFLDYDSYVSSVRDLNSYFGFLGSLSYPMAFENLVPRTKGRLSFYTFADLLNEDLANQICYPVNRFFEERMRQDPSFVEIDLFGISIVYDHQLIHALHLARLLKRTWPSKQVVLGGTAISQLYKYLKDKQEMKRFFSLCDAIVVGEGETAICEIANCTTSFDEAPNLVNTIIYDRRRDHVRFPSIRYENVAALGRPIYNHPWELYLSPARGINYSPTRGCYWNRCTFCDYGLNTDKPTSPWRERKIAQVIADLSSAQGEHGVRYVYLAVDVMAPGYLERLSDAIIDSGLEIRWSGEIRMEKIFTPERCRKMTRSGCVSISFGMESGNQRILDLIDKGTKVDNMAQTMKNFSTAGIAVQLMAFKDFPTETTEEKLQTHKFVRDNAEYWAAGGIGTFLLTGTSIVAKNPSKFGVTITETEGADMARAMAYHVDTDTNRTISLTEEADDSFDDSDSIFPTILGRPWAGGTETLHSMIYYDFHGQTFFKQHPLESLSGPDPSSLEELPAGTVNINAKLAQSGVDLSQLFANRAAFQTYLQERMNAPAEPTSKSFIEWEKTAKPAHNAGGRMTFWLLKENEAIQLEKSMYSLLLVLHEHHITVAQALKGFAVPVQRKILEFILELEKRQFITVRKQAAPPVLEEAEASRGA